MQFEIPMHYLKAIRLFAAKGDVRQCLNGVALSQGHLAATDGVCAGALPCEGLEGMTESIIIPTAALDYLFKKTASYRAPDAPVTVYWDADAPVTVYWDAEGGGRKGVLTFGGETEHFVGIEGRFPDISRAMPLHTERAGHPQFNWSALQVFEKAAVVLGAKPKNPLKALVIPNGDEATARVIIPCCCTFRGAVSPLRFAAYAPFLPSSSEVEDLV